jgi:large subunit ribosomal protein L15
MRLNTLKPGSRKPRKRVGRGHAAGQGKTCGRGEKGQHARSGGYHKVGFEGGQMPLHRRLPKIGFVSRSKGDSVELRLHELAIPEDEVVDIDSLKRAGVIVNYAKRVKVIASGKIEKSVRTHGLAVTPGARKAIEAAGGTIED